MTNIIKPKKSKLIKFFGDFSFWWGAVFSGFGMLSAMFTTPEQLSAMILGTAVTGFAPLAAGYYIRRQYKKTSQVDELAHFEQSVLSAVRANNGRITVAQLALSSGMSIDDCQNALNYMVSKSILSPEINEDGTVLYINREFMK